MYSFVTQIIYKQSYRFKGFKIDDRNPTKGRKDEKTGSGMK